ncbi:Rieske domain-containing protein-like [Astyanax mexicanus]|uniref:Rieske domain-containing protein n=1 Tax=Astyanax mexicanus TaxID=7994 RepID=A0A8T2LI84_ASTMX|nr:Rieske domain-containing protein-like [Astyanax mexicanus]
MSTDGPGSSSFPVLVGARDALIQAGRVVRSVNGRDVLVLHHQGSLHALDLHCYHSGGPLQCGDIEEFDGRLCIVCPWHKYKITLAEGEGLYQAVDPSIRPLRPVWSSKGVKQRVHRVTEIDGEVFVTLNDSDGTVESDRYQTEEYRAKVLKLRAKDEK